MRLAARIAVGVVGLVAAFCGVASLTGGALGTPPWLGRAEETPAPRPTRALLDAAEARAILDKCEREGRRVLGIHAFRMEPSGPVEDEGAYADLSERADGKYTDVGALMDARFYLDDARPDLRFIVEVSERR